MTINSMTKTHKVMIALTFAAVSTGMAVSANAQTRYRLLDDNGRPAAASPYVWGDAYAYQPRYYAPRAETYSYGANRYDNGYGVGAPYNLNNPRDRQLQGTR